MMVDDIPNHDILQGVKRRDELLDFSGRNKVYSGQWRGTEVALFALNGGDGGRDDAHRSFPYSTCLNDYLRLKALTHPHIIQVFGLVGPANPREYPAVVTEQLCRSLRQRYSQAPLLSSRQQTAVSLGIASALEYLHDRRTVCGNVAANTIIVCEAGVEIKAKLSVIGSIYIGESDRLTNGHSLVSYPQSPVVARPQKDPAPTSDVKRAEHDSKEADCWSLGVTMLEICALQESPDDVTTDLTVVREHPLRTVIEACLECDPRSRPTASILCELLVDVTKELADSINGKADDLSSGKGGLLKEDSFDGGLEDLSDEEEVPRICQKPPAGVDTLANQVFQVDTNVQQFHSPTYENVSLSFVTSKQNFTSRPGFSLTRQPVQRSKKNHRPRNRSDNVSDHANAGYKGSQEPPLELVTQSNKTRSSTTTSSGNGARGKAVPALQQLEEALAALVSTPVGRGRQLHPPIDPDLIEISQKSSVDGMAARCKRLFGDKSYELPTWSQLSAFPERAIGCCSLTCVYDGHLFAAFQVATTETAFGRAELFRLALSGSEEPGHCSVWDRVPLPSGRWHYHCYLFTSGGSLYIIVVGEHLSGEYSIFRMISLGVWHLVTRLPAPKFHFGVTTIGSLLFVVGGRDEAIWTGWPSRSVHVTNLATTSSGSAWTHLAELPRDCVSPRVVARDSVIHCIGYSGDLQSDPCDVLSLDLTAADIERRWTSTQLCKTPAPYCGVAVVNGHFVLTGGKRSSAGGESLAAAHVYLEEQMRWFPLPVLRTARRGAHCVAWEHGLLCVGGVHEQASTTASVRDIEGLPQRADFD